uniref:Gustatory receptor n=1 Tax=Anopheles epiroticus TaxID=199890 RepID=A0A182PR59_9DIPT
MRCLNKNPRHVYDVVRPLLAVSKWFGQTAFSIVGEPPYVQVKVTRVEFAALFTNFVANMCCVFINVTNSQLSRLTGSMVINLGLSFLFPMGSIFMILLAIDNCLRRNVTCTILTELFKVDRSLQRKGHRLDHRRQYVVLGRILSVLIILIAFGTIFSIGMSFFSGFALRNHVINAFSYALTGVQFMIINFHFVAAARLITFRLEAIKRCLKKHSEASSWWIEQKPRWGRRVEPIDVIIELARDFAALVHIVKRINRIYSNQIIALIAGVGMFSIFVIYASSFSYYVGSTKESRLTAILLTAWVFYVIMVWLIFFAAKSVDNACEEVVSLVHEILNHTLDSSTYDKLLRFSQQILFRRPKLQCMFYVYNWQTLFRHCALLKLLQMFGTVVTYLVILLQFDKLSEDSSKGNFLTS